MKINFFNLNRIKSTISKKITIAKTLTIKKQKQDDAFKKFNPIPYQKCDNLAEIQAFMGLNFPNIELKTTNIKMANLTISQICRLYNLFKGKIDFPSSILVYGKKKSRFAGAYGNNNMELNGSLTNFPSTFNHELGHYNHELHCPDYALMGKENELFADGVCDFSIHNKFNSDKNLKKIIKKHINGYATSSACEFVASMFEVVVNGRKLPKELWEAYREYGGPEILFMLKNK